ncbi:hypothetical protein DFJ58DRAFT_823123 [Suillus subalutaceus]|uniref:uncharacterized protein n=1 Tax=Suillus subalutaceus TaxID=48586 RepID=UPI001B87B60C|nr:uncharacterized protein DFJ58DRAFT_823123 [Suillus subalutaceus]KAG1832557.1 hypothetical protein DFJ58DRAFT_823123 [Suillus subalutaceus]
MEDCEPLLVETTIIKSSETESIRPITVYQALQAERLANDVQFSLGGAKFDKASHYYLKFSERSNIFKSLKVLLVTHVMLRTSDARGVYDLDDGTGRIYGSRSNTAGQDHAAFLAMIRQFDNSLACVKGTLIQRGQQKIMDIESMIGAGYHQAMYHTLECMKTSLMVERHKGQAHNTDEMLVVQEFKGDAEDSIAADSRAFEQSYRRNVSSPQTPAGPLPRYGDHNEGLSSASTSKQAASQLLTPLLAHEPETPHYAIVRVAHPCTVMRTPSPLSSFDSSLQISSQYSPHYYSQLAQLTATQLAIVSNLYQLQGDAIYGVLITAVCERVTQVIEITQEEFSTDIDWLLEEIYIFRPLDDDRIALTPRASV